MNKIIVSGIQPTDLLHIGNYLGSLKNFLELQKKKNLECFFFIADYHSLTENFDAKEKSKQISDLAKEFLAVGLNPKKCTLFAQSDVPEVTELGWIFNCVTPLSHLERMTQYKDKSGQQKKNINVGLLDYPVLQSELKSVLSKRIANSFRNFRNKKKGLKDKNVEEIFENGAKKARRIAQKTMKEIRKKVGLTT
ncbi:MAG: hypothetical protein U9P90_00935 [Patescibacteria group bacterium]|nr:hypothetical protein [Patescibacteria group bacterium]